MTTIVTRVRDVVSRALESLSGRGHPQSAGKPNLMPEKTRMIDVAFKELGVRSFADLGGVWGVEAGYTFYTLENFKVDLAYLVDTDFSVIVKEKQATFPQLTLINRNFGEEEVTKEIGKVGAVFLFDTLVHQVAPDWDEIIRMYAKITDHFLIFNPQYSGPETVRLFDLGEEEYFKNVPHTKDEEIYKTVFEKMDEIHPQHDRPYRDIHNVWQWGIADDDLRRVMRDVGFEEAHFEDCGRFPGLEKMVNRAFVFKRVGG